MGKIVSSFRGTPVDFELLAIKAQLASTPIPKHVEARKRAIDAKDGVKTDQTDNLEFLNMTRQAAEVSANPEAAEEPVVQPTRQKVVRKQASQLDQK